MTFENKNRYYLIEGVKYEWQWHGSICGLYEVEEPPQENDDDWHPHGERPVLPATCSAEFLLSGLK